MNAWTVPGYTELRSLGAGGFGAVMLARHDVTGTPVAIKYLRSGMLADPGFAEMFRTEAVILASLDDPNVVRLYEYVEGPAGAAIVMELVDGVTVRDMVARLGKTTPEGALAILYGSLRGLAAAHARGVVHRDYKPANVLVSASGASKLTDFGIAARTGAPTVPAGSLPYAPPEQFDGLPATPASDVYAATATFYECLTGEPPFGTQATQSQTELMERHRTAAVPMDPVPEPLRQLVATGLAKDPRYRPGNATALAATLRQAADAAYGQEWERRGRTHLGEAAVLLAALWPTAGLPAVAGFAQEQVLLARGGDTIASHPDQEATSHSQQLTAEQRHQWHLRHVQHEQHLAHLRAEQRGTLAGHSARTARAGSRLRTATVAVASAAVVAAGVTVAVTARAGSPPGPGASAVHPAFAAYQVPLATIPLTASSPIAAVNGDVYVLYHSQDRAATLSGHLTNAASGQVLRLYAQQFPFASAPVAIAADTVTSDGTASYSFQVTPTLATRYQVKLFARGADGPAAESAITTVYVVGSFNSPTANCSGATCTTTYTVYQPPSTLATEMTKPWYLYRGASGPGTAQTLTLESDAVAGSAQQVAADEYTRTVTYSNSQSGGAVYFCFKDTEAQDGTGLPNATGCGAPTWYSAKYVG